MIPLTPEMREWMTKYYVSAFEQVDALVPPELITINNDCSCTVEEAEQDFLIRVLEDDGMTVISYEPGILRVIDETMEEYHRQVGPFLRKSMSLR